MRDRVVISYSLIFLCVFRALVYSNSIIFWEEPKAGEELFADIEQEFFLREQRTLGTTIQFAERFKENQRQFKELLLLAKASEEFRLLQARKALLLVNQETDKREVKTLAKLTFTNPTFSVFLPEGVSTVVEPIEDATIAFSSLLL